MARTQKMLLMNNDNNGNKNDEDIEKLGTSEKHFVVVYLAIIPCLLGIYHICSSFVLYLLLK